MFRFPQYSAFYKLMNMEVNGCVRLNGSVTVLPNVSIYTIAMGRLVSAAICPQTGVILNSVKLHFSLCCFIQRPINQSCRASSAILLCVNRVLAIIALQQNVVPRGKNLVCGGLKSFRCHSFLLCQIIDSSKESKLCLQVSSF